MNLADRIAAIGENPEFVAFMAHSGFAFFVLTLAARWHAPMLAAAVIAAGLAALKEFWFDPRFETTPPQNIWPDGALDFSGYATGIVLGYFIARG